MTICPCLDSLDTVFTSVAVSLRWYRRWHLAAGVGFCFYAPFPLSADTQRPGAYGLSFHSYSLHLIRSNLTFSFSYSHIALPTLLFLIDIVNSTLMFSFSCCYIFLDRHNFPSTAHFLLPYSIIHISHHMECIFMSENIFSKLCLISFLPISACFRAPISICVFR